MIIQTTHNDRKYSLDTSKFIDLSIPYNFNGPQPNFYDVEPGKLKSLEAGGQSWSVAEGAGCNVPEISMNIHCSGTHTECVGHLLDQDSDVSACMKNFLMSAILVTITPQPFEGCPDNYHAGIGDNESIISADIFFRAYKQWFMADADALIIRTEPNPEKKQFTKYSNQPAVFFTNDAMAMICDTNIKHLVVDLPSVDRMSDDGTLGNHRMFWGDGSNPESEVNPESIKTITELAYIPNHVKDGFYFLNIQIPHFVCDAAPSRPLLMLPSPSNH